MLDVHNTVSHEAVTLFLNMTRANFVNQGGCCFILPRATSAQKASRNLSDPMWAMTRPGFITDRSPVDLWCERL